MTSAGGRRAPLEVRRRTDSERSDKAPAQDRAGAFSFLGEEVSEMRYQTIGEGDECRCLQCRGIQLPAWLAQLDAPSEMRHADTEVNEAQGE
jgi:hypothetical protein